MVRPIALLTALLIAWLPVTASGSSFFETRQIVRPLVDSQVKALIKEREAEAARLEEQVRSLSDQIGAGTAFNNIDIQSHRCFVIGRYLGRSQQVSQLERVHQVTRISSDREERAQDLRVSAISLGNFNHNAELLLATPLMEMAIEWNTDCAGKFGIPGSYVTEDGVPTFYRLLNEGRTLHVFGAIERGYADKVIAALIANPQVTAVALGSSGGLVFDAMRAGEFIRSKGLTTTIWSSCHSACPLVFLGGTDRVVYQPVPDFGFHQVANGDGQAIPLSDPVYARIENYVNRMGADGPILVGLMKSTPPSEMNTLYAGEERLCQANLTTWVQYAC